MIHASSCRLKSLTNWRNFVFGWLDINQITGSCKQKSGHAFALSNRIQEEQITSGFLFERLIVGNPRAQRAKIRA